MNSLPAAPQTCPKAAENSNWINQEKGGATVTGCDSFLDHTGAVFSGLALENAGRCIINQISWLLKVLKF